MKRKTKIRANDPIFADIEPMTWKLPTTTFNLSKEFDSLRVVQKTLDIKMPSNFSTPRKTIMTNSRSSVSIFKESNTKNIQNNSHFRFSQIKELSDFRPDSKLKMKKDLDEFTKKMMKTVIGSKDNLSKFEDFRNLESIKLKTSELQDFLGLFSRAARSLTHIGFFTNFMSVGSFSEQFEKLESEGFWITVFEDINQIQTFPKFSLIVMAASEYDRYGEALSRAIHHEENILGLYIFKDVKNSTFEISPDSYKIRKSFKNFEALMSNLILFSKFHSISLPNFDLLNFGFGFSYSTFSNRLCLCNNHQDKFEIKASDKTFLEILFKNYSLPICKKEDLDSILKTIDQISKSNTIERTKDILFKHFNGHSSLIRLLNTSLKMMNQKFVGYFRPILGPLLQIFDVTSKENRRMKGLEVYHSFMISPENLELIHKMYRKDEYMFFSEFFECCSSRKQLSKLDSEMIINILIEDDHNYEAKTLNSQKTCLKSPIMFFKDTRTIDEEDDDKPSSVLFPPLYPFRVRSIRTINDRTELFISTPCTFNYTDDHMYHITAKYSQISESMDDMFDNITDKEKRFPINNFIPLRTSHSPFYFELFLANLSFRNIMNSLKLNYTQDVCHMNSTHIEQAREQNVSYLIQNNQLLKFEYILQLFNEMKQADSFNHIQTIFISIEKPSTSDTITLRLLLINKDEPSYLLVYNIENEQFNYDSSIFNDIISSLFSVRQVYICFFDAEVKDKELLQCGIQILLMIKKLKSINLIYLNLSGNKYAISLLKSLLLKSDYLKSVQTFIFLIEGCGVMENDLSLLLNLISCRNLETIAIDAKRNKLTNAADDILVKFLKFPKLKNFLLNFGSNYLDSGFFKRMTEIFINSSINLIIDK